MGAKGSIKKVDSEWTLTGSRKRLVELTVTANGLRSDAQNALKDLPAVLQAYVPWIDQKLVGAVKKDKPANMTRDGVRLEITWREETNKASWTLVASAVDSGGEPITIGSTGFVGTWQVESAIEKGKPTDAYNGKILAFNESGEADLLVNSVDAIDYALVFEVEPSRTPKQYSVWKAERLIQRGIFKIEADKLFLCFVRSKDDKELPKEFVPQLRTQKLFVLKRLMAEGTQSKTEPAPKTKTVTAE